MKQKIYVSIHSTNIINEKINCLRFLSDAKWKLKVVAYSATIYQNNFRTYSKTNKQTILDVILRNNEVLLNYFNRVCSKLVLWIDQIK